MRDELTREEAEALLEAETQKYFGMSVAEFVDALDSGKLPDDDAMVIHIRAMLGR